MPTSSREDFVNGLLSLSAATSAVAHPQNGSSTMSPSFELVFTIRSSPDYSRHGVKEVVSVD